MQEVHKALDYYRIMLTARLLDQIELATVSRGEAWFHTSGAGHESGAALNTYLKDQDWLHCHYRDKALLLGRGIPSQEFFNALHCNADSSSGGRQMNPLTSSRAKNVMSMVIPVGNGALQSVGVATAIKHNTDKPIVVCSIGDGTSQQGEVLEAIAEAVRSKLPVLFLIQDNSLAISTRTQGKTFFSLPDSESEEFYGLKIHRVDGRDVLAVDEQIEPIIKQVRSSRGPAILVMQVDRLDSHSNADDQSLYRTLDEITQSNSSGDPLIRLENYLLDNGITSEKLAAMKAEIHQKLSEEERIARNGKAPITVNTAKAPLSKDLVALYQDLPPQECTRNKTTMREAINQILRHHLAANESVILYGEDIEDPKGDVFGVTKGLSTSFENRVLNAPLTESTIIGLSIGRAMAGEKPVCFIQFADFLPHAFNQIMSELATLYWRSNGEWNAPVIVMVACGAYRPGLGPFHAQSYEAILAHTPGLDVFLPSNAEDAAGLLNSAFLSNRPSIFFYPKSGLNRPNETAPANIAQHFTQIGSAKIVQPGQDLTLIGWGNTVAICQQVADELKKVDKHCEIIDIASLSPWDDKCVLTSAAKTGRVIVVHEDNHTCGFGAEIVATIAEKANKTIAIRRITRPDTYLPFSFANQKELLPSFESVLESAADLLNLSLSWFTESQGDDNQAIVTAIGSGPSDETVDILEIPVKVGDKVNRGDLLLVVEASKSIVEMTSSWSGIIASILVKEQDTVDVGAPVITITTTDEQQPVCDSPSPIIRRPILKPTTLENSTSISTANQTENAIGIYRIATATGSQKISNDSVLSTLTEQRPHTDGEIEKLTGITSRNWVAPNESALSLAIDATKKLLYKSKLTISDIDLIVCSTTTPEKVSPSLACQVLAELSNGDDHDVQAYDIFAACSGYLYSLQAAYDYIANKPDANVLVITAEALSPLLNPNDFDTYILFGDAATATLVCGNQLYKDALCKLNRPVLSAKRDKKGSLLVPIKGQGFIEMDGRIVFSEAVRAMNKSLLAACAQQDITLADIQLVVPHQASQRIMNAVADRIKIDVFSNVKQVGNTSSSSIPLALESAIQQCKPGDHVGLCAFGAGFTYGASILEVI